MWRKNANKGPQWLKRSAHTFHGDVSVARLCIHAKIPGSGATWVSFPALLNLCAQTLVSKFLYLSLSAVSPSCPNIQGTDSVLWWNSVPHNAFFFQSRLMLSFFFLRNVLRWKKFTLIQEISFSQVSWPALEQRITPVFLCGACIWQEDYQTKQTEFVCSREDNTSNGACGHIKR